MGKVKSVGIIGCGDVAKLHLEGYKQNNIKITACADINLDAAKKLSQEVEQAQCFTNYKELFTSGLVDAVSICTPPCSHEEVVVCALAHNIPVLCEKPLAHNIQAAKNIYAAAQKSGILLMTAFRHRFLPAVVKMRRLIEDGAIGEPVFFHNVFCGSAFSLKDRWFSKKDVAGGGALIDTSSHSVDLFRYLAGEVIEQHAVMHRHMEGIDVEDAGIIILKAGNGAVGSLTAAWVAGSGIAYIDIMGQKGRIRYDYNSPGIVKIIQTNETDWKDINVPASNGVAEQISHFLGAVNGRHTLSCTGYDGLRAVEIICANYK